MMTGSLNLKDELLDEVLIIWVLFRYFSHLRKFPKVPKTIVGPSYYQIPDSNFDYENVFDYENGGIKINTLTLFLLVNHKTQIKPGDRQFSSERNENACSPKYNLIVILLFRWVLS